MIGTVEGYWYSFKPAKSRGFNFEFYKLDKCIAKGWASSEARVLSLFDDQVKSSETKKIVAPKNRA